MAREKGREKEKEKQKENEKEKKRQRDLYYITMLRYKSSVRGKVLF